MSGEDECEWEDECVNGEDVCVVSDILVSETVDGVSMKGMSTCSGVNDCLSAMDGCL